MQNTLRWKVEQDIEKARPNKWQDKGARRLQATGVQESRESSTAPPHIPQKPIWWAHHILGQLLVHEISFLQNLNHQPVALPSLGLAITSALLQPNESVVHVRTCTSKQISPSIPDFQFRRDQPSAHVLPS